MKFKFKDYAIINSALLWYEKDLKAITPAPGMEHIYRDKIKAVKDIRTRLNNADVKEEGEQ